MNKVEEFCEKIGLNYHELPQEAIAVMKIGINSYHSIKGSDPQ